MNEMRILIEANDSVGNPDSLASRLGEKLHEVFSLRIGVTAVLLNTLPRYELKAKRWVRLQAVDFSNAPSEFEH